ncbi:MAG: sensor histidine kinase [Flavobacteriales bacterium]
MRRIIRAGPLMTLATATLIAMAMALVVIGLLRSEERTRTLAIMRLDGVMDTQRSRLETVLGTYEWDLAEEAAYISMQDTLSDLALVSRWRPLLEGHYAVSAVGLADERGGERVLLRGDSSWVLRTVKDGLSKGPAIMTAWSMRSNATRQPIAQGTERASDPRTEVWFGHALEDRHGDPVWSGGTDTVNGANELHVSLLIRGRDEHTPYRILRITVSPELALGAMDNQAGVMATLQLSPMGRPYGGPDTSGSGRMWEEALRRWEPKRASTPFTFTDEHVHWMARFVPCTLNGAALFIGAAIDLDQLDAWTRPERIGLWTAAIVLVSLAALLVWAFIRGRRTDEHMRRQARRSRTQERELAKALGEREILDREVHHRVKNNLQVVSSLLNLQAHRIPSDPARNEFLRGKRRIDEMALVHQKLYGQRDLRAIDLAVFLDDLAKAIATLFEPDSRRVSHSVDTQGIRTNADTAIPLGMILCELLSNCYQHAFPYATGGHIEIIVRPAGNERFRFTVRDNGKGISKDRVPRDEQLGLEIVEALADQLDGSVSVGTGTGTSIDVLFRMQQQPAIRTL